MKFFTVFINIVFLFLLFTASGRKMKRKMKKTNKVLSPTKSDSLASETEEPIRRVLISSKKPSTIRDHHIIDNFDLKISENEQILFIPYREKANNVLCEYIQKEKLGAGTFGVVYRYELSVCKVCKPSSQDLKTNKFQNLAVKIQSMVGEHYYKQKCQRIFEKLKER